MTTTHHEAEQFRLDDAPHSPTLLDVVRSEWLKLRTLRSTFWTLLVGIALVVGLGALLAWAQVATWDQLSAAEQRANPVDGTATALSGITFGQLALVVLGVLTVTGEFSTGGIRATLVAVPRRGRVVAAKVVVVGVVALVAGTAAAFLAFFASQPVLATKGFDVGLGDADVLRALFGAGLYLAASALFGLGIGLVVRSTGGAIAIALAALLVLPGLSALIPGSAGDEVQKFVTSNAGQVVFDTDPTASTLSPWAGYAVFTAWWLVLVLLGGWLLRTRDV